MDFFFMSFPFHNLLVKATWLFFGQEPKRAGGRAYSLRQVTRILIYSTPTPTLPVRIFAIIIVVQVIRF
jgi:hypothetical protein